MMNEEPIEAPLMHITMEDVTEANRLSLHCPICAGPVEKYVEQEELIPVVCAQCNTLYHKACWEQKAGKCAILGCEHDRFYRYGSAPAATLIIRHKDLPQDVRAPYAPSANGRTKRLKQEQQSALRQIQERGFWSFFWDWLLRAIKIRT